METQSHRLVTPVASTSSGLRRGYGSMLSLPTLVALSLDRNGSDMPAFAAQIDADAQPKDDETLTVEVNVPQDAFGMSFAASTITPDGAKVIVAKLDRELLAAPEEKLKAAADMVRDLFDSDGMVQNAPADYRTALIPASPASDDQALVALTGNEITEIELPFTGTPEIARISESGPKKARIPAAYIVAKSGNVEVFAADESDAITCKPTWAEIARFDSPISAIARENGSNEVVVQLLDGSYRKIARKADGYEVSDVEIEDDSAIPVGASYLGLTSAYGNGNSHALFSRKADGKPVEMSFVPVTKLPAALFGKQDAAQA